MGSIEETKPVMATIPFPVDSPMPDYDPWSLDYGRAPQRILEQERVTRRFPLKDLRGDVLDDNYSLQNSRDFLRKHGFTVVKYNSALHAPPYGKFSDFLDPDLVGEIYYSEIKELMKEVTGCGEVFVLDSVVRNSDAQILPFNADQSWQKSKPEGGAADDQKPKHVKKNHTTMHKTTPATPARIAHWDWTPLGARATIRNRSGEVKAYAEKLGIIQREDELCGDVSATEDESNAVVNEHYDGPRYAFFSVWRPLTTVTRDPLVMASKRSIEEDVDVLAVTHRIKAPGPNGDWLQELATVKVSQEAAGKSGSKADSSLEWYYVSKQKKDEVLLIKAFDSAALPGQAKVTGEAGGVAHVSADIGEAAYGGPRESIELRLIAFW